MVQGQQRGSAGRVETQLLKLELPASGLPLECGRSLSEVTVAYETYGELSEARDNVIFICHALTGDAHVAGTHDGTEATVGWWDEMVGSGKGIDTDYYHVICANILGGCKGTTGPSSVDPGTGVPYGSAFPAISVGDIVDVHRLLLKQLGVDRLAAVIGGSFGGMQVLDWAIRYPDMIDRCICVASATSLSAQALAFDIVGRKAITSDPDWMGGDYYSRDCSPTSGLSQARRIGHITYLSTDMMTRKFGRQRKESDSEASHDEVTSFESRFQVESYLDYQGEKFVERFDANSYLQITRALDEYGLVEKFGGVEAALAPIQANVLVVALSSDWLFPPEQSMELANALLAAGKRVSYCQLNAPHGHDAFLVDIEHLAEVTRAFLPWVTRASDARRGPPVPAERQHEFNIICGMVRPEARVLDLGCGGGEWLSTVATARQASGIGVDIDIANVIDVIDRGHDIFQGDIDAGLSMIPDQTYDYAVLSETLQVVRKPRFVLQEMLRVAKEGIVVFPNFGKWTYRMSLLLRGRMPKGGVLPFEWYDTPNIHLFTRKDFVELCRQEGFEIVDMVCTAHGWFSRLLRRLQWCNMAADRVFAKIAKGSNVGEKASCRPS